MAAYFANLYRDEAEIVMLRMKDDPIEPSMRYQFSMAMGVRHGEGEWKDQVNQLLKDNKEEIRQILLDYINDPRRGPQTEDGRYLHAQRQWQITVANQEELYRMADHIIKDRTDRLNILNAHPEAKPRRAPEDPPEDPPEDDEPDENAADDALDYGDYLYDQQKDARAEEHAKAEKDLTWDTPRHAPFNRREPQ